MSHPFPQPVVDPTWTLDQLTAATETARCVADSHVSTCPHYNHFGPHSKTRVLCVECRRLIGNHSALSLACSRMIEGAPESLRRAEAIKTLLQSYGPSGATLRWVLAHAAFGRRPQGHEFTNWIMRRWVDCAKYFSATDFQGKPSHEALVLHFGASYQEVFDQWLYWWVVAGTDQEIIASLIEVVGEGKLPSILPLYPIVHIVRDEDAVRHVPIPRYDAGPVAQSTQAYDERKSRGIETYSIGAMRGITNGPLDTVFVFAWGEYMPAHLEHISTEYARTPGEAVQFWLLSGGKRADARNITIKIEPREEAFLQRRVYVAHFEVIK